MRRATSDTFVRISIRVCEESVDSLCLWRDYGGEVDAFRTYSTYEYDMIVFKLFTIHVLAFTRIPFYFNLANKKSTSQFEHAAV